MKDLKNDSDEDSLTPTYSTGNLETLEFEVDVH